MDVMDSIIDQLQKVDSYTVTEIGPEGEKVNKVTNYRAINSKTHEADVVKEIASADLVRSPSFSIHFCLTGALPTSICWDSCANSYQGDLRRRAQHPQVHRPRHC